MSSPEQLTNRAGVVVFDGTAAPGGGSQASPRWANVATVTYAEVLAAGNGVPIDLVTLPTGTFLDAFWLHVTAGFDDSGSIDYGIGWLLSSGTPRYIDHNFPTVLGQPDQADDWAGVAGAVGGQSNGGVAMPSSLNASGALVYGPLVKNAATAGPLQVVFSSIFGDGTTGSFDVWLRTQAPA